MTARGRDVPAVGLIGIGAGLLLWHPYWSVSWTVVAVGVGLGAQRWVSWKHVMIVAVALFALLFAFTSRKSAEESALGGSLLGLAVSAGVGMGQERRKRATG